MVATSAARNRASEHAGLPIPQYDELSVKEIVPLLAPLTAQQLALLVAHEKATKNRVTLLRSMKKIELESVPRKTKPATGPAPSKPARSAPAPPAAPPGPVPQAKANGAAPDAKEAPARSRRSGGRTRKLRKPKPGTDGAASASRGRHPSSAVRSVPADGDTGSDAPSTTSAQRPRPPVITSSWEEEPRPVGLTWDGEDLDGAAEPAPARSAPITPAPPAPVKPAQIKPAQIKPAPTKPAPATSVPAEPVPWHVDDFADDVVDDDEYLVDRKPTYEVDEPIEDMRPPAPIAVVPVAAPPPAPLPPVVVEPDDDEDYLYELEDPDEIVQLKPPAPPTPVARDRRVVMPARRPKAPKPISPKPIAIDETVEEIRPVVPARSVAEQVLAQPLPPKPEWMEDEPTRVEQPAPPAAKEPIFRSIRSALGMTGRTSKRDRILWVAAAIVAIVVGILIGMVATRTSPPPSVKRERAQAAVVYVVPQGQPQS